MAVSGYLSLSCVVLKDSSKTHALWTAAYAAEDWVVQDRGWASEK